MQKLVLLCSSGSPNLDIESIRAFLKLFLSDRNIIHVNPFLWYFILNFIILKKRPAKLLEKYKQIAIDGHSPLNHYIDKLCNNLNKNYNDEYIVKKFFCYIDNSLEQSLATINFDKITQIILLPLYPQYSNCTHLTIYSSVQKYLKQNKIDKKLEVVDNCYLSPYFIDAYIDKIKIHANNNATLIFSCHSIPISYVKQKDSYYKHCLAMHTLLKAKLDPFFANIELSFHSIFGKGKWLGPTIEECIDKTLALGSKDIVVVAGFSIDCLETLYDLHIQAYTYAINKGATSFKVVECLNDSSLHQQALIDLIKRYKRDLN